MMGLIAQTLRPLVRNRTQPLFPAPSAFSSSISESGYSSAYMRNEIVFASVEMLATSAGEPEITGYRNRRASPQIRARERSLFRNGVPKWYVPNILVENGYTEELQSHPLVKILNNPNPFMSRTQMVGTLVMDECLAGNWYVYKGRYIDGPLEGAIGQLWRLRPDRVRIIPSSDRKSIEAYEYGSGRDAVQYPAADIIHYKRRHPLNDYYGMPPIMAIAGRIDIDQYMKGFLKTFFERGGAGVGGVLTVKSQLSQAQKDDLRATMKRRTAGPANWHETLVLDNTESTYEPMGLNRGLRDALPKELDAVSEARIAMAFGIPGSILGLLIGYESSSYANKRQDWQVLWDLTMTPKLVDYQETLTLSLTKDFSGIDRVAFDFSLIRALQEDIDKIHERHRKNVQAGLESWEEGRDGLGLDPNVSEGTFLIAANVIPTSVRALNSEQPEPVPTTVVEALRATFAQPQLTAAIVDEVYCPNCGRWVGRNMNVGATAYCPKCKAIEVT